MSSKKDIEKKLIADSIIPLHIVGVLKEHEQIAKIALRLPKWLQRRLQSIEVVPVKGCWPGPYCTVYFAFNICHSHVIEFGQMDSLLDIDTLRAFINNYKRFEKILTDYPHPVSISYNPHDDLSVVTKEWDIRKESEKEEYVTCAEEERVIAYIKEHLDETRYKVKPKRDHVLIQSHLIAGNDIGIEIYWNYKYPIGWFDEFLLQENRLLATKEWNCQNFHPRIPISVKPKLVESNSNH